jgi:hypothetical protein
VADPRVGQEARVVAELERRHCGHLEAFPSRRRVERVHERPVHVGPERGVRRLRAEHDAAGGEPVVAGETEQRLAHGDGLHGETLGGAVSPGDERGARRVHREVQPQLGRGDGFQREERAARRRRWPRRLRP